MKNNLTRSLSPNEAKVVLSLEWNSCRWVTRAEIISILGGNSRLADQLIRSLRDKRWIEQIKRGYYILIPADRGPEGIPDANLLLIGSKLISPFYFGYATAASYHNLTTQVRNTIWIVTQKEGRPRSFRNVTFNFVNLSERKYFGFQKMKIFDVHLNISDVEKTVLDCIDKMEKSGGIGEVTHIIASASSRINWGKLYDYAIRMGSISLLQRLGYLADRAGVNIPQKIRRSIHSRLSKNTRSYLGSPIVWGYKAKFNSDWQLLVNVPDSEILSEI